MLHHSVMASGACVWDVACTGGMEGMMDGVKIALFLLFNCGNQQGDASVMMKM